MRHLTCGRCGARVFFENTACGACGAALGFVPDELDFASFDVDADGQWTRVAPHDGPPLRPCANRSEHVCNWMVPADSPSAFCASCNTTHIIPALSKPENRAYWQLLEEAKRRLFYSLLAMKLPTPSRAEDPDHGVSFRFLEAVAPEDQVLTGHDEGVITLNIAEADDARREAMRAQMHEPYRTLLGHFRHEIGHYYWDRLICDSVWLEEFRALFGDERADYDQALKAHYATPVTDWPLSFISAYASSHPWEDWAECWAHYMHIHDGLETAAAWGLRLDRAMPGAAPVQPRPIDETTGPLEPDLIAQWLPVSQFINAMDRSLGTHDSYPFVLPSPVVDKLEFIHKVVSAAARRETPMRFSAPPPEAPAEPVRQAEPESA